jgi:CBS domain-containing protein
MPAMTTPALEHDDASRTLAEQALETTLGDLPRKTPIGVAPDTPLGTALATMHERGIGSLLVLDPRGAAVGILTRHDIIGRVTLPQVPLAAPISRVMSAPVHTLGVRHTVHDAALLMSRCGIRHVPVTDGERVVSLVSERDVFHLQRLSLRQISGAIRGASDVPTLVECAHDIRRFAGGLLAHGIAARQLTQLISHLNDLLTERMVTLFAGEMGLDLREACWLALGSEGRSEQTLATDQDNGIVFASDDPERDRPRWLALGRRVNQALDACGYPLCRGGVMAGEPACCMTPAEWRGRFEHWMAHGAPADLLQACIHFDFRPLVGTFALAQPLREQIARDAARLPRFLKQMAQNALRNAVPLGWLGSIETQHVDGRAMLDLKTHGAMVYVDAARVMALATGTAATGTRERLQASARVLNVPAHEREAWVSGFEYLQFLRLRAQVANLPSSSRPNLIEVGALNDIDRRVLREALRVGKRLQQRMELDYLR